MATQTAAPRAASQKVIIKEPVRFSYANVFEPKAPSEGAEPKYSVSLIIPKSHKKTISDIERAIEELKDAAAAKLGKLPKNFKLPLRDGDEERPDDEAYRDAYFLNASAKQQPGIVHISNIKRALNPDEFKSGDYGFASINFYVFDVSGNRGIAAGLNNLMKTKDGESLAGRASASEDFAGLEMSEAQIDDLMGED